MNIVITMAGLGSRFEKVGYKVPKYEIIAKGKTLFHWSMISLTDFFKDSKFIFIVRKENKATEFIKKECASIGILSSEVIEIDYLTDGQATTAYLAKSKWNQNEPLLIYNIDTYIEEGEILKGQMIGDGCIPCFSASGENWSFVLLDEQNYAIEVREKKRISDHCTVGAYYFASASLYEHIYIDYYSDDTNLECKEKYIAPMYNYLIAKCKKVTITSIDKNKVHVLGTPEELETFMST